MKIKVIIALLMCTLFCVSCTDSRDSQELNQAVFSPDNVIADLSGYTIIRSDIGDAEAIEAMQLFKNAVKDKLGIDLKVATDWVKRGESAPLGTKEILIGATNRPESTSGEALLYNDYRITFENERLAFNAGSGGALIEAVRWYTENCIDGALYAPSKAYYFNYEYPMKDGTLGGVKLSDIGQVVYTADALKESAELISVKIGELCGIRPTVTEKATNNVKSIQLGCPSSGLSVIAELEVNEGIINWVGDTFLVTTRGGPHFPNSLAVEKFTSDILGNEKEQNSLKESVTFTMNEKYEIATDALINEYMVKMDKMIEEIKNSKTDIEYTGTAYYVSTDGDDSNDGKSPEAPWKTIEKVNAYTFGKGDCVFFKRGDRFRITTSLEGRDGVSYSAYGEGAKPLLIASVDGSGSAMWEKTDYENIYEFKGSYSGDVATIVFDGGKAWGIKIQKKDNNTREVIGTVFNGMEYIKPGDMSFKDESDLRNNLEFYCTPEKALYIYCALGNPGEVFKTIELCDGGSGISMRGSAPDYVNSDIVIDNLAIYGVGAHGIGAQNVRNVTVQYCTFEWIGGVKQGNMQNGDGTYMRFGNAVESYGWSDNFVIHDCYASQIYDCCWTAQKQEPVTMNNVQIYNNVSEYCNTGAEVWNSESSQYEDGGIIRNLKIHDNYTRFNGYGWSHQRPNKYANFFFGASRAICTYENNDVYNNVNLFTNFAAIMARAAGPMQLNFHDNVYFIEDNIRLMAYALDPSRLIAKNPDKEEEIRKAFDEFEAGAKYYITKPNPLGDMYTYSVRNK